MLKSSLFSQAKKIITKEGRRIVFFSAIIALLAVGCDYELQLAEEATESLNPELVGLWERVDSRGREERLLVLPQNDKEYLISFPAAEDYAMFGLTRLWAGEEMALMQIDWFGTAQAKLPEDDRTLQYADFSLENETLTVRLLNPEVISDDIDTREDFIHALRENLENSELFRKDEMRFKKVD